MRVQRKKVASGNLFSLTVPEWKESSPGPWVIMADTDINCMATPDLSVVIPTLNAGHAIRATLDSLGAGIEIIVCDGGSHDGTCQLAADNGVRVIGASRGRGSQLAAGAAAAGGSWLLFLHADTVLEPGWRDEAEAFMAASPDRAAAFRFALDDGSPQARRLERMVAWRCRVFGLPYGDQGLLISRALYRRVGGYRPLPLMEDVDMVRRLGRDRVALLSAAAVSSAERWRRDGWLIRSARNLLCLGLFGIGIPASVIRRVYG